MTDTDFTDGFCEPILWGLAQSYTIPEIAIGLELELHVVVRAIEARTMVRFPVEARSAPKPLDVFKAPVRKAQPLLLTVPAKIDPKRTDEPYLAWARARRGAAKMLAGSPP